MRRKLKVPNDSERLLSGSIWLMASLWIVLFPATVKAQFVDPIGLRLLRTISPGLDGSGIRVAQPEGDGPGWQMNPVYGRPGLPFRYEGSNGVSTTFPNAIGAESGHANDVGNTLFGPSIGIAPGVSAVDSYDADFFLNALIFERVPIQARVVNQSFIIPQNTLAEQMAIDREFDDYADRFNVLFVSGAGNGGGVFTPASSYNGLGVGAYGGATSIGPTGDGRSKPDIVAPAGFTSISTPQVAGAALLLLQAAARGDGGTNNVEAASDIRVVKALLLNGASKPGDWAPPSSQPLDTRYGAGILHVFNSWNQLRSGRQDVSETTVVPTTTAHPSGTATNRVSGPRGWVFVQITNSLATEDTIHHFYLDLPTNTPSYVVTLTLTWNRKTGFNQANDLDLHFIDRQTGASLGKSDTFANNVEHLYLTAVPPGSYDIQVLKNGAPGRVTAEELYALAFDASAPTLTVSADPQASSVELRWPLTPPGLQLETSSLLGPNASWSAMTNVPTISGNEFTTSAVSTNTAQFFRLRRP